MVRTSCCVVFQVELLVRVRTDCQLVVVFSVRPDSIEKQPLTLQYAAVFTKDPLLKGSSSFLGGLPGFALSGYLHCFGQTAYNLFNLRAF